MKIFLFIFVIIAALLSSTSGKSQNQFYCGRKLANALAYLCPAGMLGKRAEYNTIEAFNDFDWPWMSRAKALEGSRGKRTGPGVISECCDQPCSLNELLSYC
ncbi:unnamed protein product [Diatraea saccharalis]|uniref:Insulin-like domain-containing protein n=1 Tax=Diatraea saccharalis TaxID=40085 RepID=A0A9N9WIG2_9NEOP|nr:unnamed protein product [Diatraea saccharalis]